MTDRDEATKLSATTAELRLVLARVVVKV